MAGSEFCASLTHRSTQLKCLVAMCIICVICLLAFDSKVNFQWSAKLFSKDSYANEKFTGLFSSKPDRNISHVNRTEVEVDAKTRESSATENPSDIARKTEIKLDATTRELNAVENPSDTAAKCSPMQYILFLKTHKAGSSTVTNIFFRYGDSRDLSFVLGSDTLIGWPTRFRLGQAFAFDGTRPNFLCSHTRFNKKTMNFLFPKDASRYITIVRNPVSQFESIFNYMGLGEVFGFGKDPTGSLKAFLKKGIAFKDITKTGSSRLVRNPMLFDLGMDYKMYQNAAAVKEYIAFLEKEFDLVMVADHFDESVVLMKRLLCWEFDDILYVKSNERFDKERAELSEDVKENIRRWNKADMLLFQHFNQTLWRKIEMEGQEFYDDLATFRRKKAELKNLCFTGETSNQLMYGNKYAKGMTLKSNLSPETKVKCERMTRAENPYLAYLRTKRSTKLNGIFRAVPNEDDQEKVSWDVASDFKYDPV